MKQIVRAVFLLIILSVIIIQGVKAEWIEIPLVNPGAETGDMTGWTPFNPSVIDPNYQAIYDPENANEGDYYFAPDKFDHPSHIGIHQMVDLANFSQVLQHVEFSANVYMLVPMYI